MHFSHTSARVFRCIVRRVHGCVCASYGVCVNAVWLAWLRPNVYSDGFSHRWAKLFPCVCECEPHDKHPNGAIVIITSLSNKKSRCLQPNQTFSPRSFTTHTHISIATAGTKKFSAFYFIHFALVLGAYSKYIFFPQLQIFCFQNCISFIGRTLPIRNLCASLANFAGSIAKFTI